MTDQPHAPPFITPAESPPPPPFSAGFYLATGQIILTSTVPDEATADRLAGDIRGMGAVNWLRDPPGLDFYVEGGEYHPMPAQPSPLHAFDWATKVWVDPALDTLRNVAWERIKVARAAAMLVPVDVPDIGIFDADDASVVKLTAVLASLQYQPVDWFVIWTLFNNSSVVLDKTTFPTVASAILAHSDAIHQVGRALREAINSASTKKELNAINWPALEIGIGRRWIGEDQSKRHS